MCVCQGKSIYQVRQGTSWTKLTLRMKLHRLEPNPSEAKVCSVATKRPLDSVTFKSYTHELCGQLHVVRIYYTATGLDIYAKRRGPLLQSNPTVEFSRSTLS
jgi:hypothetical protein